MFCCCFYGSLRMDSQVPVVPGMIKQFQLLNASTKMLRIHNLRHYFNTCNLIILEGADNKSILPTVILMMGLEATVLLSDDQLDLIIDEQNSKPQKRMSMEDIYPVHLCYQEETKRTILILTCPQSSCLFSGKLSVIDRAGSLELIHTTYCIGIFVKGALNRDQVLSPFTSLSNQS